jgi:hypothetical protein
MNNDDDNLQSLCRKYLKKLRYTAKKHGLGAFVDGMIAANRRRECRATEKEVNMLARCVDDERLTRIEVPEVLGKSYRQCVEDGDFGRIRKLRRVGVYGKVSVILRAMSR